MQQSTLVWRERRSSSRFIESVWVSRAEAAITRTAIADPCISLSLIKSSRGTQVILRGPSTKPRKFLLAPHHTCVTIRLKSGVLLKDLPTNELTDTISVISNDSTVRLGGRAWQFPDFNKAESFVSSLHSAGVLGQKVWQPRHASLRTLARQTKQTTGLSPYQLFQLQRMHHALRLLKEGVPAAIVASELDFVDQPHLVRASRRFFGRTPKQLRDLPQIP